MVCIFVNSEEPPIWYVPDVPTGQNGMQTPQYKEVLRKFTLELQNRGHDPSDIIFQQVQKDRIFYQDRIFYRDRIFHQDRIFYQDRIFHQKSKDGASCHTSKDTLDYIGEWLPDQKLISGRTGNHLTPECLFWSPSSPDLSERVVF